MPAYAPPTVAKSQAAVVKGSQGVYVMAIDNQKVTGIGLRNSMGGNEVLVAPGRHRIYVERTSAMVPTGGLQLSIGKNNATFDHDFAAGQEYDIDANGFGYEMENEATGEEIEPIE